MKQIFIGLILLFFSGFLYAQCDVAGKVTDQNGEPIVGAHVMLLKSKKGALTDDKGRYTIEAVSLGAHQVVVSHVSYRLLKRALEIPPNIARYLLNMQLIEEVVEIDQLVVKATRAGEKTPVTYSNLDKEAIEKNNLGQDIPYLLKWTPSAVVTSDAGTGIGYTGIRIRGTDPTRINVTINGIPLNDAESQGVFWVDLPDFASSTEDIQIQRGVGTSTNGAGAFGASINLNTNKLHQKPYGKLSGSVGSFNTLKANAAFGTGLLNEKFAFDGRISKITSDGFIDRATADLTSFYLSGTFLGKHNSLKINVFSGKETTYQAWNGVPAQYVNDENLRTFNTAGTEKEGKPHPDEVDNYKQTHYQVLYNQTLNRNWNFGLAGHYTKGAGYFEQYKAGDTLSVYGLDDVVLGDTTISETNLIRRRWLDNDYYGLTYSANYTSDSRKLEAVIGGAWSNYKGKHFGEVIWAEYFSNGEKGHRYYDNDAQKMDFNIFGKANYQLTNSLNGYLDLQFRQVNYEFFGIDSEGQNVTQKDALSFFNPKAGVYYDFNENTKFYGSFGIANREPNRNDYTESSPENRPKHETLFNTEIGFQQNWEKAALGVNLYQMSYKNQLALTGELNDVGAAKRVNIPKSYRMGIELIGGAELYKGLEINTTATFSLNKAKEFTEYIDNWDTGEQLQIEHKNTDLALSPNVIVGAELAYNIFKNDIQKSLTFALLGKYVGKQFIDNTSNENTTLDPYFFSDFRIKFKIETKFINEIGITLLVRNLFDSKYSTNAWTYRYFSESYDGRPDDPYTRLEGKDFYNLTGFYPQAGRNYLLGLSFTF
jgi:iron complex outermembrane recepter protein